MGVIDARLDTFGWRTTLQMRNGSSKITINKLIATGVGLEKGQPLYCYVARDAADRPVVMVYLDGKPRNSDRIGAGMLVSGQ